MKAKELISQMTLEEKASLMSGANFWNTKSVERLGIPEMMLTDGPHGLRKQGGKPDHLGLHESLPATCYPSAAGLANTWDPDLLEELGEYLGAEAVSERVSVILGPGCNIKRNPLCGRNFEYFSEDPFLSGKMAAALIRGIQKKGVSACVKHFAVNSQELRRMTSDSVLDERTLREIYLPAFEMAVKEGKTGCLMTSYNRVNGTYANEDPYLLREILYKEWGFEGMVVSDWGGNNDRVEALKAGATLEMPSSNGQTDRQIVEAVREGRLREEVLDEQVKRLLRTVYSSKEAFESEEAKEKYDAKKHHAFAAKVAEKIAVLLKNEENILPLGQEKTVAVIGDFAKKPRYQGAGSSKICPTGLNCAWEALNESKLTVKGFARGFHRGGKPGKRLLKEACMLAKEADVVLLWLGLDEGGEAEGVDRENIFLPENQLRLLEAVAEVNPNIVVILSCGCVVDLQWENKAKAILHGYLGGQAGAPGIVRLLTGEANPCGKLAETIPMRYEDCPSAAYYPGKEVTAEYREGIYVGYRYYDTAQQPVRYPFGFGLSYTSFAYEDLQIEGNRVSFFLKNVGKTAGEETAQLYIRPKNSKIFRPLQELKGFSKIWLQPGEKKKITLVLEDRSFALWSIIKKAWVVEPGCYEICIGASSRDIRLRKEVMKTGEPVENPYEHKSFSPYYSGNIKNIQDESFRALLGREIPGAGWDIHAPIGFNDTISQGKYLRGGLGVFLYHLVSFTRKLFLFMGKKEIANNVMFVMHLPWRGVARMSGFLGDRQVLALLEVINRRKGGFRELLRSLGKK